MSYCDCFLLKKIARQVAVGVSHAATCNAIFRCETSCKHGVSHEEVFLATCNATPLRCKLQGKLARVTWPQNYQAVRHFMYTTHKHFFFLFTVNRYRKLYVNMVSPESGNVFRRLGDVNANMQGTLGELRRSLDNQFGNRAELKNKDYVFIDRSFKDIAPRNEDATLVENVYRANVKIKIVRN